MKRAALIGVALAIAAQPALAGLEVRALQRKHVDGSGCSLNLVGQPKATAFEWEYVKRAWVNRGGSEDLALTFIGQRGACDSFRAGDVCTARFAADGFRVEVRQTVTSVCPPGDEQCEAWGVAAILTIRKGHDKAVTRLEGVCGS